MRETYRIRTLQGFNQAFADIEGYVARNPDTCECGHIVDDFLAVHHVHDTTLVLGRSTRPEVTGYLQLLGSTSSVVEARLRLSDITSVKMEPIAEHKEEVVVA